MENFNAHLITFGGGSFAYRRSARRLTFQSEASGLFKTVTKVTDKSFRRYCSLAWKQHRNFILNSDKGFGYWIWKPIIIEKRLTEIPVGDILVYMDAGCELNLVNPVSRERMQEYFQLTSDHGSLAMQLRYISSTGIAPSERRYSKGSLISSLQASEEIIAENQLMATVIFMQNNNSNHFFLKLWQTIASSDNYSQLIDVSDQLEDRNFIAHRHDQSIFSLLYKDQGRFYIPDETHWKSDWTAEGASYPIWAMRNRTGISKGAMKVPDAVDRIFLRLQRAIGILTRS